jgi:hypothetical protein
MCIFQHLAQPLPPRFALGKPVVNPITSHDMFFIIANKMVNSPDNVPGIPVRVVAQKSQGSAQQPLRQFPLGSGHSFTHNLHCHLFASMTIKSAINLWNAPLWNARFGFVGSAGGIPPNPAYFKRILFIPQTDFLGIIIHRGHICQVVLGSIQIKKYAIGL